MDPTFGAWAVLIAGLIVMLLLDLFVLHRGAHEVSIRNAAWSTAGFVAVAVGFGAVLGAKEGADVAEQFFAGYVLELALILIFVGAKFILTEFVHISVDVSLLVIVGVVGLTIAASLVRDRKDGAAQ